MKRIEAMKKFEKALSFVNDDTTTVVCAADIVNFFDEWYGEFFPTDDDIYSAYVFYSRIRQMYYFSYTWVATEMLACNDTDMFECLAHYFGYDYGYDFAQDFEYINDTAIDGFVIWPMF